jgi:2'-5' RNA ligase
VTSLGRAFVAVVPPDHVLDAIEARVAPARVAHDELRWSRREQWHLTLRFLGPVPDVDGLLAALRHDLASVPRADGVGMIGAGAFPRSERGSVVWLGVQGGAAALTRVAEAVEWASVAAGFEPEARAFTPHLTVARAARPRDLRSVVDRLGDAPIGAPWAVDEVVLISSETRPSGAVYAEVARVPLARMGE